MIVGMKKITLLCLDRDQDPTLAALGELGVVHLSPLQDPAGDDMAELRDAGDNARRALAILQAGRAADGAPLDAGLSGGDLVQSVLDKSAEIRTLTERVEALTREQARFAPYGAFDPARIASLAEMGVTVKLGWAPGRVPVVVPSGVQAFTLSEDKSGRTIALVGLGDFEWDGILVDLPDRPTAEIVRDLAEQHEALARAKVELAALTAAAPRIEETIAGLATRLAFATARAGMGAANRVCYLQGFCPADAVANIQAAARENGWGLIMEEPAAEDRVPTLIRSPKWVQPIKVIFDMLGILPGYREVDISAAFLLFLSIFFAMLIGDAGYGCLFLLFTALARARFRKAPAQPFVLMTVLSVCTVVWGVLTGTYFGIAEVPALLDAARVPWLGNDRNLMTLCFLLGAIHLSLAHAWNAILAINSLRALAQIGWGCVTWMMFFAARWVILDEPFPGWVAWMGIAGVIAVVLFMTPLKQLKTEWTQHVMLPLSLVGNFVDLVSYMRLFAVGSASLALAQATNELAVQEGAGLVVAGLGGALILFIGHTINILLGALGIVVHGVRLNTLEFSGHMGLEWSGVKFEPFEVTKQQLET